MFLTKRVKRKIILVLMKYFFVKEDLLREIMD